MGLDPERFTIFINAGWAGGGNIPAIFEQLVSHGSDLREAQAIFVAGRNESLRLNAARTARRAPFPVKVVGYTEAMERVMRAADVMVSKLGGLTTFEALATRLPIIGDTTTRPMPQETNTAELISGTMPAYCFGRPATLLDTSSRCSRILPNTRRCAWQPLAWRFRMQRDE